MAKFKGSEVGKTGKYYQETKAKLRRRLEAEGRWNAFCRERVRVKKETKLIDPLVWMGASFAFPPLDGSPPEFTMEDYEVRVGLQVTNKTPAAMRGIGKNAMTQEEIVDQQIKMVALTNGDKLTRARKAMWDNLLKKVAARESKKTYVKPTISEEMLWAYQYAGTNPEDCTGPHLPPSRGALRLFKEATDAGFYPELARLVLNKFSSKDEDITGHGIREDKRKKLLLMEKLEDFDPEVMDDVELAEAFAAQEEDREVAEMLAEVEDFGVDDDEDEATEEDSEDELDELAEAGEAPTVEAYPEPAVEVELPPLKSEGGDADHAQ